MIHNHGDLADTLHKAITWALDTLPTPAFWVTASVNTLIPFIVNQLDDSESLPLPKTAFAPFLFGLCSLIAGGELLADNTSHRPNATKIKGVMLVLNSFQSLVINLTPALGALTPPSAAAMIGVQFALSLDNTRQAVRRYLSEEYWLKDTYAMLDKNEERITALENEIKEIKEIKGITNSTQQPSKNQLPSKQKKLQTLNENQTALSNDLITKIRYILITDPNQNIETILPKAVDKNSRWRESILATINNLSDFNQKDIEQAHLNLAKKTLKAVEDSTIQTLIWGLAFAGMVLLCIPGLQIPAAAVLVAAAAIYAANIIKNNLPNRQPTQDSATNKPTRNFHRSGTPTEENRGESLSIFINLANQLRKALQRMRQSNSVVENKTSDLERSSFSPSLKLS